jgi:hypothetical protein
LRAFAGGGQPFIGFFFNDLPQLLVAAVACSLGLLLE